MRIKIIKCTPINAWYKNKVGEKYYVCDDDYECGYGVMRDSFYKYWYIDKQDCEIIKNKNLCNYLKSLIQRLLAK